MFTFIELQGFSKRRPLLLPDDEFRAFQETLIENPEARDTIAGTGGFRKIRWSRSGMGKRSGIRVIYYNVTRKGRIYLALLYPKNEQDDLTEEQKRVLMHLSNMLI
ncbi:type II toxin-antitoxin system RelE/ParE family toxin [Citrobacter portucalensis]|uniref:type II toxin-antitoxin system RelE/ParE family toxin n=1 Tax=Citrobacter portucalensis TaxID=1639133 RepID=UPI00226B8A44|nr:type II toxin-antitoxin system RelE/ParE family toxin [Citrobacter portucalensis]MCX9066439.1 type II toxin-antitoxin system RelE/ParE family toxin [Citrobacter portucalensis]